MNQGVLYELFKRRPFKDFFFGDIEVGPYGEREVAIRKVLKKGEKEGKSKGNFMRLVKLIFMVC